MPPKKILSEFVELVSVIRGDDAPRLESMLVSGIDVNGTDVLGRTLLMIAAEVGNARIVRILLAHRAKLDTRDRLNFHDGGGKTALYRAVEHRHHEVAQILIAAGADMEVRDKLGQTALHSAVANGDFAMTDLLLGAGASPHGSGRMGTPLSTAVGMGFADIARLLLLNGADPNHPADSHRPVLATAVFSKKPELCRMLLDAGALANATNQDGKTALDIVGLTVMPDRLPGGTLTSDQMFELRGKIAAAAVIRSMLIDAEAAERTHVV